MQSVVRFIGSDSRDALIYSCAKGINVRPRSLHALAAILLLGGIAGFEHERHTAVAVTRCLPCCAEIYQLYGVFQYHYIRRADVAMDKSLLMHLFERYHNGHKDSERLLGCHRALGFELIAKAHTVKVLHNDIGGIVLDEKVKDMDYAHLTRKFCESFCLGEKALSALIKGIPAVFIGCFGDLGRRARIAVYKPCGVKLLDGYYTVKAGILTDIGYAKAALAFCCADYISAA